jgi:Zc3h12a-like Ribonuclease NYN domain
MKSNFVVVDGSNIATQGRRTPSLAQLDEAVREFRERYPDKEVVVVVDATFGHRIDSSERNAYEEAAEHGELVSPPAGAIGRGDAFLLRVAERVGGQVLSNDSFQEFHGEHPWLFDEGRLIGGMPVPGVGWIFMPRSPVRGPTSRASRAAARLAVEEARQLASEQSQPQKVKAVKTQPQKAKAAKAQPQKVKAVKTQPQKAKAAEAKPAKAGSRAAKVTGRGGGAKQAETAAAAGTAGRAAKTKETKPVAGSETTMEGRTKKAAGRQTKKAVGQKKEKKAAGQKKEETTKAPAAKRTGGDKQTAGVKKAAGTNSAKRGATATGARERSSAASTSSESPGDRGGPPAPDVKQAIDLATEEVLVPSDRDVAAQVRRGSRRRGTPTTSAVNDPLTFLTFVSEHPIGSVFDGIVSSFTSHGAMVDVGEMHCYAPLAALGHPPPARARDVLKRGETRRFALVALDVPRRAAEVALEDGVDRGRELAQGRSSADGSAREVSGARRSRRDSHRR